MQDVEVERHAEGAAALDMSTKRVILAGVLIALFLAALDQTIVATALPRMLADLHGMDLLAWVSASYLLTSTAMVPVYGKLSDQYGRKPIVITGILVFLSGSALCGVAPTMKLLVAARALQGLGAAALTSTAFAVPADLFAPAERARYQGLFGSVFGLASVVGPYLGGLITDAVGWRWVFYVNVPVGALALAFIALRMPKLGGGRPGSVDLLGAALLLCAVVPFLLALTLDRAAYPWSSPVVAGLLAGSLAGVALFLWVETRASNPILPLGLFRNRTFALLAPISALVGSILIGTAMFLSIYLVNVLGISSTAAGETLIPLTLSTALAAMASSMLVHRVGRWKPVVLAGLLVLALAFAWLATLDVGTTLASVRLRMLLVGLGLGPCMPLLTLALQNAVPFHQVGAATASRQFFQQLGGAVAVAALGALLSSTVSSSMEASLAPVRAALPSGETTRLDLAHLRGGLSPHTGGPAAPYAKQIDAALKRAFTKGIDRIYRNGVPVALLAFLLLLFVPQLPLRRGHAATPAPDL